MKRGLLIAAISFFFFNCGNTNHVPADIIPPQKMQDVLWDMMRADRFLVDFVLKDSSLNKKTESIKLYRQIFAIHNIDREKFKRSFIYYEAHPSYLKVMMDSISRQSTMAATAPAPLIDTSKAHMDVAPLSDTVTKKKIIINE